MGKYSTREPSDGGHFIAIQIIYSPKNTSYLMTVTEIQNRRFASQSFDCHDKSSF